MKLPGLNIYILPMAGNALLFLIPCQAGVEQIRVQIFAGGGYDGRVLFCFADVWGIGPSSKLSGMLLTGKLRS